ncbi:MAG: hypothetical protein U0V56_06875 [Actinomycetota bacterium]
MRTLEGFVLSCATALAAIGTGGLIFHELRLARASGQWFSGSLGWTLLWATGLTAMFADAWSSGSG